MKNQAVVDIEDYYSLRKRGEENEAHIKELKKKEGELLEQMKMLKAGIITIITNPINASSMEPPFQIEHKEDILIIRIKHNADITRFRDVVVLK